MGDTVTALCDAGRNHRAQIAMSRMLFVALSLIGASPVKAEVLTLSCDGTMKADEEQAKPQAITEMGLIVNFDAGVVTGFTGITGRDTRSDLGKTFAYLLQHSRRQ
jgi:hypothetical protein